MLWEHRHIRKHGTTHPGCWRAFSTANANNPWTTSCTRPRYFARHPPLGLLHLKAPSRHQSLILSPAAEMSSEQRSSSAVRNLRSMFENKASEQSPAPRDRSPGSLSSDLSGDRPRSRIRASFVPVEPTMAALASEQPHAQMSEMKRESSAGLRRESFSGGQSGNVLDMVQDTVKEEQSRRDQEGGATETIPETAVESAAATPAVELNKELGLTASAAVQPQTSKKDKEAENPDKHVTGAEEEPVTMRPADPTSEQAVSGGEALPPVAEDLRKTTSNDRTNQATKTSATKSKPAASSTKTASKPAPSSVKSPPNHAKPATSATSQSGLSKKASRSSLTAPTAASVARAAAADKQTSPTAKAKPREVTKPADVSSRLTAPTAASRARLEQAHTTTAPSKPAPTTTRVKPAASKPTPRPSLAARPESRTSQTSNKKPTAPVDGSFLDRMMRPTAASASKTHEKPEVKSPPPKGKQLPLRPKTNGHVKGTNATRKSEGPKSPVAEHGAQSAAGHHSISTEHDQQTSAPEPPSEEVATAAGLAAPSKATEPTGNETPLAQTNGHQEDAATLDATPAAMGATASIR